MSILAKLQRVATEDARQFAYRILKFSILELLLRPGEKLNEAELASSLEMSRTPVRDVLGRLGRENLVDQIPQRGAFVARIDYARAEQAAWVQTQTGVAVLELLYTQGVANIEPLRDCLARQQFCIATDDRMGAVREAIAFYQKLYALANMELAWDSLQEAGADLFRLACLYAQEPGGCESTLLECRSIAEALQQRHNAAAVRALTHFYARLRSQIPNIHREHPALFTHAASENA